MIQTQAHSVLFILCKPVCIFCNHCTAGRQVKTLNGQKTSGRAGLNATWTRVCCMGRSALLMPALACPRLLTVLNNKEGKGVFAHFHDARFRTFRGLHLERRLTGVVGWLSLWLACTLWDCLSEWWKLFWAFLGIMPETSKKGMVMRRRGFQADGTGIVPKF